MAEPNINPNAAEQQDVLTDHCYDGIQEYDNPTPGWWTWLFIATIAFSAIYTPIMILSMGYLGPEGFYERAYTEALRKQYGEIGDPTPTAEKVLALAGDEKWVKVGASLYLANCASCHGSDGSGVSAPNLTDDRYLYVKKPEDIADVISRGRKNGAMPAWENRLQPVEVTLLSAYVASLRGKNLPSAGNRPPEGDVAPQWSNARASN